MKTKNSLVQLRDNLNISFNRDELKSLCFDLSVDYDSLPNRHKNDMIQELILLLGRQRKLDELVIRASVMRSHLKWPKIPIDTSFLLTGIFDPIHLSEAEWKERKQQLILLEKVKQFWINGYLQRSLPDQLLELRRQSCADAVENPWAGIMGTAVSPNQVVDTHQSIYDIYVESGNALLILGQPGAGKTTLMLQLAKELVTLAETIPTEPIPVVLNLSTWSDSRTDLITWIVEELTIKYQIPRKISRPWIENNDLLFLFDGLDEVAAEYRVSCIDAINQFRFENGLTGVVVCSRIEEYQQSGIRLKLGNAISLETLTPQEVDSYLENATATFSPLQKMLQEDSALKEIATSPLMLCLISTIFQEAPSVLEADELEPNTTEYLRDKIFSAYVQNMLAKFETRSNKMSLQMKRQLMWLSQKMSQHHQAIFLLEQIQPSWLDSKFQRWGYVLLTRMINGISVGIMLWYLTWIALQTEFVDVYMFLPSQLINGHTNTTNMSLLIFNIVSWNMLIGFLVGIVDLYRFEYFPTVLDITKTSLRLKRQYVIAMGIGITLLTGVVYTALIGCGVGIIWSVVVANLYRTSYQDDIHSVESLQWSWTAFIHNLPISFLAGFLTMMAFLLFQDNLYLSVVFGLNCLLIVNIINGLRPTKLEETNYPNQGIKLSIKNCLKAAILFGLFFGVLNGLLFQDIYIGLGWMLFFASAGVIVYGSVPIIKHYTLRLFMWRDNQMPLRPIPLLSKATRATLMHKVGGGYVFIHRLLQDYFANLQLTEELGYE